LRIALAGLIIGLIVLTTWMQAYHLRRKNHFKKTWIVGWCLAGLAIVASIVAVYGAGTVSLSKWLNMLSPI
jgi:hypothetical protein